MTSVRQAQRAVTKAVAQHHGCCTRGLVFPLVLCEVVSHLVVLWLAWFTTAYIIPVYLLAHYALALLASNLQWWELLQSPLLWLFPPGTGCLVAPSQGGCLGPKTFRVFSWCLRLAVLGFVLCIFLVVTSQILEEAQAGEITVKDQINCTQSHHCDGLPAWLRQPWWSDDATCVVRNEGDNSYPKCLEERSAWYLRGSCNYQAGCCYLVSDLDSGRVSDILSASTLLGISLGMLCLLLAPPLSLLLSAALCCCGGPLGQGDLRAGAAEMSSKDEPEEGVCSADESEEVTLFDQWKFVGLTLFPFVLDVFSDVNGIIQYVLTGNFQFAVVSTGIFAMSMAQQLRRGMLHKFGQAAIESMHRAHATDDLEVIMLSEKSTEAAAQLLLQFYAFIFVTSSDLAIWSFLFSMALSLKGVAEAAYYLVELDLYHKIAVKGYDQMT